MDKKDKKMKMHKMVDGVRVELCDKDCAEMAAMWKESAMEAKQEYDLKELKKAKKMELLTKLGLTEEEFKLLTNEDI